MTLHCISSGSHGNAYLLIADNGDTLLIEAGMPLMDIKKAIDFRLKDIKACIISHRHGDHAAYVKQYAGAGIMVLALEDVFEHYKVSVHTAKKIEPMKGYKVADFYIRSLPVTHDVPCLAYVIQHKEMGKMAFITDTPAFPFLVNDINHLLIEANYSDEELVYNIENGLTPQSMRERLLQSHMEISTTQTTVQRLDNKNLYNVVLLHLSAKNSHKEMFAQSVRDVCSATVHIAEKDLKITMDNTPY